MRQGGSNKRSEENVITGATYGRIARSRVKPPAEGEGAKHMFVRPPRDGFSNVFGRSSRARSNAVCYRHVSLGGPHSNQRHDGSLLHGQVPLIIRFESAVP